MDILNSQMSEMKRMSRVAYVIDIKHWCDGFYPLKKKVMDSLGSADKYKKIML